MSKRDRMRARKTDPDSSHRAADYVSGDITRSGKERVLESLREHGPQTTLDLEETTGLPRVNVSPLMKRMEEDDGTVVRTGHKGKHHSILWGLKGRDPEVCRECLGDGHLRGGEVCLACNPLPPPPCGAFEIAATARRLALRVERVRGKDEYVFARDSSNRDRLQVGTNITTKPPAELARLVNSNSCPCQACEHWHREFGTGRRPKPLAY